jgi:putative glycerol-1-phosphate prenyltransferase
MMATVADPLGLRDLFDLLEGWASDQTKGLVLGGCGLRDSVKEWKHIFKLDPERTLDDHSLERLCLSGSDAIMVGGTTGATFDNVIDLLSRIRRYELPCVLEVSEVDAIVPGFDLYFIPLVLNGRNTNTFLLPHKEAIKSLGGVMNWNEILMEGYVVFNPDSTVAKLTDSQTELTGEDLVAYARMTDKMLRFPIFYIEYSGAWGDMELVRRAKSVMKDAQVLYGGGIQSPNQANEAREAADTIVVGNIIYENMDAALATVLRD